MERIDKLNRNQVLKELQSFKKYNSSTQKQIGEQFDGIASLRKELYRLEKRKNKTDKEDIDKDKNVDKKNKSVEKKDKKHKDKNEKKNKKESVEKKDNKNKEESVEKKHKDKNVEKKKVDKNHGEILVLMIWERKDRDERVSTILLATDMKQLKEKFTSYFKEHREDEDYLEDDEFEQYSKDAVNLLDKMNDENYTEAPEFNSAYIIELHHSTL